MKCLKLYSKHDLRCETINDPIIDDNQILVQVKSVGICRSDIHYYSRGEIGGIKITDPITPGHEFSGQVVKVGKNILTVKIGDRVAVDPSVSCGVCEFCRRGDPNLCAEIKFCGTPPIMGALAEYYVASEIQLFKIPESLTFEDGALLEPLGVALHSVRLAKPKGNQKIAVLGLGSIGLCIVQLAALYPNNKISVFDDIENRVKFAKRYDIELALKIDRNLLKNQCEFQNCFGKFDIVFESAGSSNAVDIAMKLAKPGGKVVMVGISPDEDITISSTEYRRKGLTLIGVRRMKDTYPEAIDLVKNGKISFDGMVTHRFSLEMGASAYSLVEKYEDGVIKAVINP